MRALETARAAPAIAGSGPQIDERLGGGSASASLTLVDNAIRDLIDHAELQVALKCERRSRYLVNQMAARFAEVGTP